jgi:hypothetical protein
LAVQAQAQLTLNPLTGFGGSDGWLAPGEGGYAYLTTGNTERGLAYGNGHLYLASRANVSGSAINVRILDPLTGGDLGALNTTGITGGTLAINMISASADGSIYAANLASATTYKVYKWANESSTPTVAYSGAPLTGARIGDTLDLFGSGSSTRLVAGYGNSPTVAGNNGYAVIDPTAGTATHITFSGTPPNAGDFRLGITFGQNDSTVYGAQGGSAISRLTTYSGSSGTLAASLTLKAITERPIDFANVAGVPLLATIQAGNFNATLGVDPIVRIYEVSDPLNPSLLGQANLTTGSPAPNANGTGQIIFGDVVNNTVKLWAMASNEGIQGFLITVPEPGAMSLALLGLGVFAMMRRLRK